MPQGFKSSRGGNGFQKAHTQRKNHVNVKKSSKKSDRSSVTTKKINKSIEALLAQASGAQHGGPGFKFVKVNGGDDIKTIKGTKLKTLSGIKKK